MMLMKKNPTVLVTCILLLSSLTALAYESAFSPKGCCFKFYSKRLPKNKVLSYTHTDKLCSMEGVLFEMKEGKELCVDPNMQWVKNIIKAKNKLQSAKVISTTSVQYD
ncbi:C-C motif chemokine 4-like [Parambassis ranga]|uniref:C-C motif chemokine n=1 Tax=Parambassis ranga TaxID=210632 RepID=A0A6P7HSM8_9TELE|nr:C-C motif chemokine 4-like [Parambassis ranga]